MNTLQILLAEFEALASETVSIYAAKFKDALDKSIKLLAFSSKWFIVSSKGTLPKEVIADLIAFYKKFGKI